MTLVFLFTFAIGQMWGADITIEPTLGQNVKKFTYGLFTLSYSSTKGDAKISSNAIAANTKEDVITINFATTKSDFYIKSVEFQNLSNGALSSADGNISSNKLTVSGSKSSINVVLTSNSNSKGTVKVKNVIVNVGDNEVETITFSSISDNNITFASSAATTGLSSITSSGGSISSNILSISNNKYLSFTSANNITYIALLTNDDKVYVNSGFETNVDTYADGTWSGSAKTVSFTNKTGGGRSFKKAYVIVTPPTTHALAWNFDGGSTTSTSYTVAGQVAEGATITYPAAETMSKTNKDFAGWSSSATTMPSTDLTITALWTDHVAKYTVKYMDGTTVLGTEEVNVSSTPAGLANDPTKDCYTFAAWSPALNTVSGEEDDVVEVNATWTPNYFTESVDFEEDGSDAVSGVASKNIVASAAGEYDGGKASENWAYKGWKIKSNGATVKFLVPANKKVTFKFGYLAATAHVAISDDATNYSVTGASNVQDNPLKFTTYSWIKSYDAIYTFTTGSSSAAVIKAITVQDVYNATFTTAKSTVNPTSASNVTEVTLPTPAATIVGDYTFAGWKANKVVKDGDGDDQAIGTTLDAGETYTLTDNTTFTAQWTETSTIFAITKGTHANGDFTIDPASQQEAGEAVTLAATPNEDFVFSAWEVYKTGDQTTTVEVTNNAFTMPAYPVTVNAIFVADPRAKVLYLTSVTTEGDKLYEALKDIYNVTVAAPASQNLANYALVVLHESIDGKAAENNTSNTKQVIRDILTTTTPVLNTKSYFYNNSGTKRWDWGAPNAGKSVKGATLNSEYCNIASHPLFAGVTITDGFFDITAEPANKCMQPVGSFTSGKEGYTLATTPNNDSGNGTAIHELTPAQRGGAGKYLMISVSKDKLSALNANGQKLFQNAAAYLIGSTAWEPEAPKTVTHTLTGVTTSSDDEVCAGVAYAATYEASEGYSLPDAIVVKVNGTALDAEDYTWNPSAGALSIPAAQVTGNIEIIVNGVFNCPAAGSGDVLFSWTPKDGMADKDDIAAGTYDLPGDYLTSIVGGSALMYLPGDNKICIRNSRLAYNGDYAYVKLTVCALKEGDKFEITSPAAANNIWVSTSATRPADAEAAAAVIEQGTAYYIPSTSALIDATEIYLWRAGSLTELGTITITRSKKFTVTYAASDLTEGTVPAAVDVFDGQKIIVAGPGTMVKGADHFAGWKDADNNEYAEGDELTVTADMTLTAQWTACTPLTLAMSGYQTTLTAGGATTTVTLDKGASTGTVTWESSDATILSVENGVITPLKGGTATVTAHVAEDATYCANDITSDEITVNCVVTYDANGGEGTMVDATGTTVTIAANGFTYDSHKFLRWNTQPDGLGDDVAVGATVNENKTLYAIWKEVTCTAGANIFSIEFTNAANVTMSYNDPELDLASNATIVGGNAYMKYFNGTNTNQTVVNANHQVVYGTNNMYLKLDLDCELQAGDVISFEDFSGNNQLTIAVDLTSGAPKDAAKKVSATGTGTTRTYTVEANDALEGKSVLFIGRPASGSLYHKVVTVYRPLPDASVPTIDNTTPADAEYTGAALPMTVSADAEGVKDLHYQWYKEAGETDLAVGEDAASYTPTASGEYYCVVTNSPTGYTPKSATSRTATITMISSDATLAWLKADGNDIALSAGVYAYEYTLPYNYAAEGAPTVTYATTDANATITFTPAATKTGTATINVLAQDGVTSHEYTVKFNEFSGCVDAYWFAKAADAPAGKANNSTVFTNMTGDNANLSAVFNVDGDNYTVTRSTGSSATFGKIKIPAGFSATVFVAVKTGGSNRVVSLVSESATYPSANLASSGNHVAEFENIPAGTYDININSNSNFVMVKAVLCKYPMVGVSLPATESVLVGQTVTLTPVFDPTNASNKNVTWASDAEGVATVVNGVVTGVAAGTAKITVTTEDGNFHATCAVTVSELDCDTYMGNLFALTIKDEEATSVSVNTEEINMSTYATIENGTAFVARTDGSGSHKIATNQSSVIQMQYNTDKLYLKLNLQNCALRAGDMITITGTGDNEFSFTTDATRATTYKTTGHKYVVQYGDALVGASTIYVWRAQNSNSYLKSISIDRVAPSYPRSVNPAYLGTLCWTNNAAIVGATLFEFAGKNENNYLVFDEVISKRLEAGKPYIFMPENGITEIKLYNTDDAAALTQDQAPVNNMYGTITGKTLVPGADDNMYYFSSNHIWRVGDFSVDITVPAYYCYIDYPAVLAGEPAPTTPAPGRRRVTMGVQGSQIATGMGEIEASETPMKVMIDGQLFIIRGEKMFDATGRLVK